uniref:Uncharacterized protein n=1 Tax=Anguilla anguilla TaxID=7936 RepID=A0A0E9Q9A2_ANGAN
MLHQQEHLDPVTVLNKSVANLATFLTFPGNYKSYLATSDKFGDFSKLWQPPFLLSSNSKNHTKITIHRFVNDVTSAFPSALALPTFIKVMIDL